MKQLSNLDELAGQMAPDQAEISLRQAFLEISAIDIARLKHVHARLAERQHSIIDSFYQHLGRFPALRVILTDEAAVQRLKQTLGLYFASLSSGEYGPAYVQHRLRVGIAHQNIGLEPQWYIGAYRKYLSALAPVLRELLADEPESFLPTYDAMLKVICFDMGLAIDTYIKAGQQKLEHVTTHDPLTDLSNRVLLLDRLSQAITFAHRSSRHVAVLVIDLDRFKTINDSLGHQVGDQVILEVGRRLLSKVRDGDTVARMGGDEFVVLLADVAREDEVAQVARKIISALSLPMYLDGQELAPVGSIGISIYPKDGDDSITLLKNADAAMYRAKQSGRGNFQFYAQEMNARALDRLRLESHLRHALERKEFVLFYQPQMATLSGEMIGVEALLRWQPPGRPMVMPDEFISIAEETGLIVPIGEWVLRCACAQHAAWKRSGYGEIRIAVNLSARQFKQKDLEQMVAQVLVETGCDAHCLELEITESMIMDDPEAAIASLRKLADMGVQLSIDDFGTGYSSLSYLKRFPIHALKIDRSFVQDISSDSDDAAIAKAVIVLAHSMKLKVVAEGVETLEQITFLREQGCDYLQGYYFSRPLPAEQLQAQLGLAQCTMPNDECKRCTA